MPPPEMLKAAQPAEQQAELQTPVAESEREDSQDAYIDSTSGEARQLLQDQFQTELRGLNQDPSRAFARYEIEKFISDNIARVQPPGSDQAAVVTSTAPLRAETDSGKVEPVDLDLQREGAGYEPANSPSDVSLPAAATGVVHLQDGHIGLRLISGSGGGEAATAMGESKLFYHEAATDTDLIMAPITGGVEQYVQIRSANAPERFSFEVDLPAGASLRRAGADGLEVVRDDIREALIASPVATDAQGAAVTAKLNQSGPDSFDLIVPHRTGNTAFPVLVDPPVYDNWWSQGGGQDWAFNGNVGTLSNWPSGGCVAQGEIPAGQAACSGGFLLTKHNQDCYSACWGNRYGLYLFAPQGWSFPGGSWAQYTYQAPGLTTYMSNAWIGPVFFTRGGDNCCGTPHVYYGAYSTWNNQWSYVNYLTTSVDSQNYWLPSDHINGQPVNLVVFGMAESNGAPRVPTSTRTAMLGGAEMELRDPEAPTISVSNLQPRHWYNGQLSIDARANDPGLGVQTFRAAVPLASGGTYTISADPNCGGTRSAGICSQGLGINGGFQVNTQAAPMPEGINTVRFNASDPLGSDHPAAPIDAEVRIDRTKPSLTLTDDFDAATRTHYTLSASADDHSSASKVSGVKSLDVYLDGQEQTTTQPSYQDLVASKNPTLYWKLDETSGTTAADSSGFGRPGTYVGSPALNASDALPADLDVGAVDLNGNTQYVTSSYVSRRNLIANPSLEGDISGWGPWFSPAGSVTRTTTLAQTGAASLKASSQPYGQGVVAGISAASGKYYSARAQLRGGSSSGLNFQLCYLNSSLQILRCDVKNVNASSGWTQAVINGSSYGAAPSGTIGAWLFVLNADSHTNQTFYVDSVTAEEGASSGSYFDGSSPGARWEGTSNNSVSALDGPFTNGKTYSFEGWANRDSQSENDTLFSGTTADGSTPYLKIGGDDSQPSKAKEVAFFPNGTQTAVRWANAWPGTGQWVHWVLVFNEAANTAELFINGQSMGAQATPVSYPGNPGNFRIGTYAGQGGFTGLNAFNGRIDEVAVYDRALSPAEIRDDYRAVEGPDWDLTWTHDFSQPPAGDHTVRTVATDWAGNQRTKEFDLDVAPVAHATLYDGDPDAGGQQLAEEWAQPSTSQSRRVDPDGMQTRTTVPCAADPTTRCPEYHSLATPGGEVATPNDWLQVTGTSPSDDSVPMAGTLLVPRGSDFASVETGQLSSVLAGWQTPPPGAGSTFSLVEHRTPADDLGPEEAVRYWIDDATSLPVKSETLSNGQTNDVVYYDYDATALHASALDDDFFSVQKPMQPAGCLTAGLVPTYPAGGYDFSEAGMVHNSDPGFDAAVNTADGQLVLEPVGDAAAGSVPRATLGEQGVTLQAAPEDEAPNQWVVNLSPDQQLIPEGDKVAVAASDGQIAARISSSDGSVSIDPGEDPLPSDQKPDDQVTASGSEQLYVKAADPATAAPPCITAGDVANAGQLVQEFLTGPPPPAFEPSNVLLDFADASDEELLQTAGINWGENGELKIPQPYWCRAHGVGPYRLHNKANLKGHVRCRTGIPMVHWQAQFDLLRQASHGVGVDHRGKSYPEGNFNPGSTQGPFFATSACRTHDEWLWAGTVSMEFLYLERPGVVQYGPSIPTALGGIRPLKCA